MDPDASPLRANLELKARIADRDAAVRTAQRLGAADRGEEQQVDTYFTLGRERLKLRETSSGAHCLIRYSRPDVVTARKSQYRLTTVREPASLRDVLARQWGVRAVVRKRRRLLMWHDKVRIHVDQVEGLGDFLEFEALLGGGYDEDAARVDLARLAHDFGIADGDLVATSYATLVLQASGVPTGT